VDQRRLSVSRSRARGPAPECMSRVPTVGHLSKGFGHTPQDRGHLTQLRRVQGGQAVEQRRGGLLTVGYGSSPLPARPTRDANSSPPMPGPEVAAGGDSVSRQDRNGASARQRLGKVGRQSECARCPALSGDRRRRPEPIWSSAPTCFPNFRVVTSTGGPRCCTRRWARRLYDDRADDLPGGDYPVRSE
jgi:hypothetical protein